MAAEATRAPLAVYMLADHLDAVLAAGEDLVARGQDWRQLAAAPGNAQTFPQRQRAVVEDIRALEMMVIARVLKGRDHARGLGQAEPRFGAVANLFVSGTAALLDAVADCGDATTDDFETGDGVIAYARSRGLIAPDAATVSDAAQFTIDDSFLIAKRAALGPLMDMAASFLDALETYYDLFDFDDEAEREIADEIAETHDAAAAAAASEPASAGAAKKPAASSRMGTKLTPRTEFGQRHRSPLN